MKHIKAFVASVLIGVGLVFAQPALAVADPATQAQAVVENLVTKAHDAINTSGDDQALRAVIADTFAFDIWQKFLLGQRADKFSDSQKARMRDLLPGFLAALYYDQFAKGLDQPPVVKGVKPVRNDQLVSATFTRGNGKKLNVGWRVREIADNDPRVIDIMVGGTSFLLIKRDEFAAIIDRAGADGLIAYMQEHSR